MKKLFYYLTGIIVIIYSCKETSTLAVKYNDEMMNHQDTIVSMIDSLDQLIIRRDTVHLLDFQKEIIKKIDQKIDLLNTAAIPEEGDSYKEAIHTLFNSYKTIVEEKYSQVISITLMSHLNLENDTIEKFNQLINEINQDFSLNIETFLKAQKEFAEKNKFSLVEDIKQ